MGCNVFLFVCTPALPPSLEIVGPAALMADVGVSSVPVDMGRDLVLGEMSGTRGRRFALLGLGIRLGRYCEGLEMRAREGTKHSLGELHCLGDTQLRGLFCCSILRVYLTRSTLMSVTCCPSPTMLDISLARRSSSPRTQYFSGCR
jgi:hypothetical protein